MATSQQAATVLLPPELLAEIAQHGETTYPDECCGILLGREIEGERSVERLVSIENSWDEAERANRFLIGPDDVMRAEREARHAGLDVLGFYHSHPDAEARPSEFDRDHAWPWYTYLITSIGNGKFVNITGWQLHDDRSGYQEATIR